MTVITIAGNLDISQYGNVTPPSTTDNTLYEVQQFAYFIQIEYDLNSLIHCDSSHTMWSFDGLSIGFTDVSINPILCLPVANNIQINAGLINANNPSLKTLGTFPVTLSISITHEGFMTASIAISGIDVNADVVESNQQAQVAYWPINNNIQPVVVATTVDILNQPISVSDMTAHFDSELNQILDNYNNINLIQNWGINLAPISASTYNPISNYAIANNIVDSNNFFNLGGLIVASLPFSYMVSVNDYGGNIQTLIPTTNVFGVISQI